MGPAALSSDEMFEDAGVVRPEARLLLDTIESLEEGQLLQCQRAAERLLLQLGIILMSTEIPLEPSGFSTLTSSLALCAPMSGPGLSSWRLQWPRVRGNY
jgi:hypothetical protein